MDKKATHRAHESINVVGKHFNFISVPPRIRKLTVFQKMLN